MSYSALLNKSFARGDNVCNGIAELNLPLYKPSLTGLRVITSPGLMDSSACKMFNMDKTSMGNPLHGSKEDKG